MMYTALEKRRFLLLDVGCEFCGDQPREMVYLSGYTRKLEEEYISRGLTPRDVKTRELVFQCSCGIIADSANRELYNEHVNIEREHIESIYYYTNGGHLLEFETMQSYPKSYKEPEFNVSRAFNPIDFIIDKDSWDKSIIASTSNNHKNSS